MNNQNKNQNNMNKKIITPAILESVNTRVDKSLKLVFGIPELAENEAAVLLGINREYCHILISVDDISIEDTENISDVKGNKMMTPSQQLRFTLKRLYEKNDIKTSFEEYYNSQMNIINDHFAKKL